MCGRGHAAVPDKSGVPLGLLKGLFQPELFYHSSSRHRQAAAVQQPPAPGSGPRFPSSLQAQTTLERRHGWWRGQEPGRLRGHRALDTEQYSRLPRAPRCFSAMNPREKQHGSRRLRETSRSEVCSSGPGRAPKPPQSLQLPPGLPSGRASILRLPPAFTACTCLSACCFHGK